MNLRESFIRDVITDVEIYGPLPNDVNFVIDSRTIRQGDIFVALTGDTHDGHSFIAEALQRGAVGIMIDADKKMLLNTLTKKQRDSVCIIIVKKTLDALYALAVAWRKLFTKPIVAVTGSIGKTSTKEIAANIMRYHGKACFASFANQNTKLGVAINILRIRDYHDCAILEAGINARNEMTDIVDLLRPDYAVITGIAHSHLEGLGSINDVAAEKRAIFKYFSERHIGIINGDQALLAQTGYHHPIVKFGLKTTNQIQARKVRPHTDHIACVLKIYGEKFPAKIPHAHQGILINTLAASAIAYLLGVPAATIAAAVQASVSIPGRFEHRRLKNNKGILIHDAYNANPESMKAALMTLSNMDTKARKIVVIGDMLELGPNSAFWHRQLGRVLRKMAASHHIILVGNMVQWTKKALPVGASVDAVSSWEEAIPVLEQKLVEESVVLVKGSHGTGLHNLAVAMSE